MASSLEAGTRLREINWLVAAEGKKEGKNLITSGIRRQTVPLSFLPRYGGQQSEA